MDEQQIERLRKLGREAREARFIELGRRGANHDLRHPDRKEWELLRDLIAKWGGSPAA